MIDFLVLPDRPTSPPLLHRARHVFGDDVITHPSGRPWIITDAVLDWDVRDTVSQGRVAVPQSNLDVAELAGLTSGSVAGSGWDDAARTVTRRTYFLGTCRGLTRIQGSLSTSRQLFWTVTGASAVASNSIAALRHLTNAQVDRTSLALALVKSLPILPFVSCTPWEGIRAVGVGQWLGLPSAGDPSTPRWWYAPAHADLTLGAAAIEVRAALQQVMKETSGTQALVSSDMSGGYDSTSLCYLLHHLEKRFVSFRTSSSNGLNDETERAKHAAADLRTPLVELPPLVEASTAVTLRLDDNASSVSEGPLVWAASRGYLELLAPAVRDHGSRVHYTGLGGDELFDVLPGMYRSIWQQEGLRSARRIRHRQLSLRLPVVPLIIGLNDRRSYRSYLGAVGTMLRKNRKPSRSSSYSWFPAPTLPPWLTDEGRELVLRAFEKAYATNPAPLAANPAAQQMVESIAFQGKIVRQINAVYSSFGISWEAPYIDDRVVEAVLRAPMGVRMDETVDKPLLAATMSQVVPASFFDKRPRGDFTADVYVEHSGRKESLLREFRSSRLGDLGIVDTAKLRPYISAPSMADVGLLELESCVVGERWLRSIG